MSPECNGVAFPHFSPKPFVTIPKVQGLVAYGSPDFELGAGQKCNDQDDSGPLFAHCKTAIGGSNPPVASKN